MSWLSIPTVRKTKPDRRSERQIEDELDAEFAFHLEQLEHELIAEGMAKDDVRKEALRRFGNLHRVKDECRRAAMKEQIMMKRIHLAVTVALLVGFVTTAVLAFQMYRMAAREREMAIVMRMQALQAEQQAQHEAATAAATNEFLQGVLAAADPASTQRLDMRELLDKAEARLPELADRPELQAKVRATIEEARKRLETKSP